jgi:hypothetical protein
MLPGIWFARHEMVGNGKPSKATAREPARKHR